MKRFEYAKIIFPNYSTFELFSTDPKIVSWVLDELKKIVPSYQILYDQLKDLSGNLVKVRIDHLSNKDSEIEIWLVQQLCHNGWEPFAVNGDEHGNVRYIHFRLEKNS